MKRFGLTLLVAGLATAGWCVNIPSFSSTTVVHSTAPVVQSTATVVQSTTAVNQSSAPVVHAAPEPVRPSVTYVCPFDSPICPFVGCYSSHNYVGCSPIQIMSKTRQVKVVNLNNGSEAVVDRQQIRQLSRLSGAPASDTEVLLDCATPGANCTAADQHHYVSCKMIRADITGQLALLACGNIIDVYMPLSLLYTTKPVTDIQSAIPKSTPVPPPDAKKNESLGITPNGH